MKKGYLLKHEKPTRIFHWVNMIVFLLLFISALSIFNKNLSWLAVIFGGLENAALVHKYLGFAYIVVPLLYILTNWGRFKKFMGRITSYDSDDMKWLKMGGGNFAPLIKGHAPPQGKYNAGQKMLALMIIFFSGILAVTGLIMFFFESFPPSLVRWSYLCHSFSGIFLGCGIIVHAYLAVINPATRIEMKTMLGDGYIEEDFARSHNQKWCKENASK